MSINIPKKPAAIGAAKTRTVPDYSPSMEKRSPMTSLKAFTFDVMRPIFKYTKKAASSTLAHKPEKT